MSVLGQQAAIGIIVHLIFIAVTWWALQAVNIDPLIRKGKVVQARLLMILLTIAIGTTVGNFFLDYLNYSQQLPYLF
ncbi:MULTISPECIES: DUF1146 family protein [Bacillus]|jgi:uncharacterized integral membrane protein (TIGR02327 family)|uniref:DUF1146 family protein n=2 Tax=Bacillus mojavensis subgroup TaxID=653388 RepID=A0AAP3CTG6_BACMO|nr:MULTISPECIES: DUF1146 family protein [Bacillus]MBL6008777.1 DUF1146 domain-containing protein [Bacillus halotolerans]MCC2931263.1 DUF1146 family protein [Bacillus sp. LBG-1-113]MCK8099962.1 DUF1146 family protein [Bacillus sp. 2CMS4F]MCY8105253.1 DUF1146 family protein [Bacillus mojavensis]MCY8482577.1 DUF1146 family protein [Bacillus mojavensis]